MEANTSHGQEPVLGRFKILAVSMSWGVLFRGVLRIYKSPTIWGLKKGP